jgi:Tol biopolymer transport system component
LLDANTGHVCELSFGGWADVVHWSSDGRYLAIVRATEYYLPIHSSDLIVLDTVTGNLTKLNITPSDIDGQHYVDDFAWAPDNRHLLAIGHVRSQNRSLPVIAGLYLVDFISGTSVPILPASTFYASSGQNNLAWSPDGSKLLILCPTMQEEHVCFVSVQRTGQ